MNISPTLIRAIQRSNHQTHENQQVKIMPVVVPTMLYFYTIEYLSKDQTFVINSWVTISNQMMINIQSVEFHREALTMFLDLKPSISTMIYEAGSITFYHRFRKYLHKMASYYRTEELHIFHNQMQSYYFSTPGKFKLKRRKE
jgi:hypothetical protein